MDNESELRERELFENIKLQIIELDQKIEKHYSKIEKIKNKRKKLEEKCPHTCFRRQCMDPDGLEYICNGCGKYL